MNEHNVKFLHPYMHGFCHLTYIPMRAEASGRSELVSQLIFGDSYKVMEEQNGWLLIINHFDNYHGWISAAQFHEFDFDPSDSEQRIVKATFGEVMNESRQFISGGSNISCRGNEIYNGRDWRLFTGDSKPVNEVKQKKLAGAGIVHDAIKFLNTPYLWGGRTFMGIDCSGLVQIAYKMNGITMPRDAYQQADQGDTLHFIQEAKPGDLAFFDNEEGKITHVGIVMEDLRIIHAHGSVRIDRIDQHGIFNPEKGKHSHNLRLIKKIV